MATAASLEPFWAVGNKTAHTTDHKRTSNNGNNLSNNNSNNNNNNNNTGGAFSLALPTHTSALGRLRLMAQHLAPHAGAAGSDRASVPSTLPALEPFEVDVVVVGAGFSGLLACRKLLMTTSLRVALLDSLEGPGGVWRASKKTRGTSHAPLKTALPATAYLPLLGGKQCRPGSSLGRFCPQRTFSPRDEVAHYCDLLLEEILAFEGGDRLHVFFETQVVKCQQKRGTALWDVFTDSGAQVFAAKYLLMATGGAVHDPTLYPPSLAQDVPDLLTSPREQAALLAHGNADARIEMAKAVDAHIATLPPSVRPVGGEALLPAVRNEAGHDLRDALSPAIASGEAGSVFGMFAEGFANCAVLGAPQAIGPAVNSTHFAELQVEFVASVMIHAEETRSAAISVRPGSAQRWAEVCARESRVGSSSVFWGTQQRYFSQLYSLRDSLLELSEHRPATGTESLPILFSFKE